VRKVLKKIENAYFHKGDINFSIDENQKIDQFLQIGLLNANAFIDITTLANDQRSYKQNTKVYPLSERGYDYLHKNVYAKFRDSVPIRIITDLLLIISFILALMISINDVSSIKQDHQDNDLLKRLNNANN
jgi:hypothetical protein